VTESRQTRTRSLWVCAATLGLAIFTQASQSQQNGSQPTLTPQFRAEVYRARVAKVKKDIQAIETALTMFRLDNHMYPTTEMGLKALVERPNDPRFTNWRKGGYLSRLNKDPWGHDYQYRSPGTHGNDCDLYSLGDGGPTAPFIGNWNLEN
jgi:general secretion pathway protein G